MNAKKANSCCAQERWGGETDPDVPGECLAGLVRLNPDRSIPFVAGFLSSGNSVVSEAAALALGASHHVDAQRVLLDAWERAVTTEEKKRLLLPIGLLRRDEAFDLLLSVVRDHHIDLATAAIEALSVYGDNEEQRLRIERQVTSRTDPALRAAYTSAFADRTI